MTSPMELKDDKLLYQWNYLISDLIPKEVKLKRKIWLKKGEILLEKKGDDIQAYLLGTEDRVTSDERKIIPYLWVSSLVSNNSAKLKNAGGSSIPSADKLGTSSMLVLGIGRINTPVIFPIYNKKQAISNRQCNTKGNLLMALLRGLGIQCRFQGFTIDQQL